MWAYCELCLSSVFPDAFNMLYTHDIVRVAVDMDIHELR